MRFRELLMMTMGTAALVGCATVPVMPVTPVVTAAVMAVTPVEKSEVVTMMEIGKRAAAEDRVMEESFRGMMEAELKRVGEVAAERKEAVVMAEEMMVRDWMVPVTRRIKKLPENVEMLPEAQVEMTGADLAVRTRNVVVCCAIQKRIEYRLMEGVTVARTGDSGRPLEAVGKVEVRVWSRESEDLYPEVPAACPGFRMATKEEADEDGKGEWGHFVEVMWDRTGLPVPALAEGQEKADAQQKMQVVTQCCEAEFREATHRFELRFRWDVAGGKWVQMGKAKRLRERAALPWEGGG